MKRSFYIIFIISISCEPASSQKDVLIPKKELQDEAISLKQELIDYHSGLYWFNSEEEFENNFRTFTGSLDGGLTEIEYYRAVSEFITSIRCGHTRVRVPEILHSHTRSNAVLMPITVVVRDDEIFVDEVLSGNEIESKDQIIAVNDLPVSRILQVLRNRIPGDGYINSGKDHRLNMSWPIQYAFLFDHTQTSFSIRIKRNDQLLVSKVPGFTLDQLMEHNEDMERPLLSLDIVDSVSAAIMNIRTFSSSRLGNYRDFLGKSFQRIEDESVRNLILDLRGNGGGRDEYGALLVSYLANRPFGYFKSIEVTEKYNSYGNVISKDNKRWVTAHSGLSVQQLPDTRFEGTAYVIIDGGCYSTCADVASVLKFNQFATLVGIETGGGATGNTSGNSRTFRGSHSKIEVNIPYWRYLTAGVPESEDGQPVRPDIIMDPEYRSDNKDSQLQQVLEMIARN